MGFLLHNLSGPKPSSERAVPGVGSRKRRGSEFTEGIQGQAGGEDAEFGEVGKNPQ